MNGLSIWPFLLPVAGLLALLGIWWLYRLGREVQVERARESFRLQQERLVERFLKAGGSSGKPRGLRWMSCVVDGDFTVVRDRNSRRLAALLPMVIQFEPVDEADLEDMPAAREPRRALGVFHFQSGEWKTEGHALFNLENADAAVRLFGKSIHEA